MQVSFTQFMAAVRQIAAFTAVVIGAIPETSVPENVKPWLVGAGGVLLAVEHYVADPSTGATTTTTTTAAPTGNTGTAGTV